MSQRTTLYTSHVERLFQTCKCQVACISNYSWAGCSGCEHRLLRLNRLYRLTKLPHQQAGKHDQFYRLARQQTRQPQQHPILHILQQELFCILLANISSSPFIMTTQPERSDEERTAKAAQVAITDVDARTDTRTQFPLPGYHHFHWGASSAQPAAPSRPTVGSRTYQTHLRSVDRPVALESRAIRKLQLRFPASTMSLRGVETR